LNLLLLIEGVPYTLNVEQRCGEKTYTAPWHAENGEAQDPAKLKAVLRTEIDNVARSKALQGYEIPREFIIETRPFSKDNHLLTDSNKPARGQLKKRCDLWPSMVQSELCLHLEC
jgi:hypothetical protein